MTKQDEAILATMRRYREWVSAGMPRDWRCAEYFADMERFRGNSASDENLRRASLAVVSIWKALGLRRPSMRTVERVLATLAE